MTPHEKEVRERVAGWSAKDAMAKHAAAFLEASAAAKYSYNFFWLGRPIIQYPQDIVATQELIWEVKPDLIIETGIAHGGSLILSASTLALIEYAEAVEAKNVLDPAKPKRRVLGIDIDIRPHNRAAIEAHPMRARIDMIQGSSIAPEIIAQVKERAKSFNRVMVFLDSNHTHDHVLAELEAYAPLTSKGSYCIVYDTLIEDMPIDHYPDRPWGKGNNPKTAVWKYLETHNEFEIDKHIDSKLLITVASDGFLKRKGDPMDSGRGLQSNSNSHRSRQGVNRRPKLTPYRRAKIARRNTIMRGTNMRTLRPSSMNIFPAGQDRFFTCPLDKPSTSTLDGHRLLGRSMSSLKSLIRRCTRLMLGGEVLGKPLAERVDRTFCFFG